MCQQESIILAYIYRVKGSNSIEQDFIIDKITNSIVNTISGDSFQTEVSILAKGDLKSILKKNGWKFNWRVEYNDIRKEVYKLHIKSNSNIVQGLLSITIETDHVFMNLIENAPFNVGRNKIYQGVAGNLVAYACKISFQRGFEGYVSFKAKTKLIEHYEKTLGAYNFRNGLMIIETRPAKILVNKYFKN